MRRHEGQVHHQLPRVLIILACAILFIMATEGVAGKDVSVEPTTTVLQDSMSGLFILTNEGFVSGTTYRIAVNLSWNATAGNRTVGAGNSTHVVNKYTKAGTGSLNATGLDVILLCANIVTDQPDDNPGNNRGCWTMTRPGYAPPEETENVSTTNTTGTNTTTPVGTNTTSPTESNTTVIGNQTVPTGNTTQTQGNSTEQNVTQQNVTDDIVAVCDNLTIIGLPSFVDDGEQLSYRFSPWQAGDKITYWIEDVFGEDLKKPLTTESNTKKTYTPRTKERDTALVIKAERERQGCARSMASAIVVVRGDEEWSCEEEEKPAEKKTTTPQACPTEDKQDALLSLYVRAQNYQENVTLYGRTSRAGTAWLFGEESPRKIDLPTGSFAFNITPRPGNNTFGLAFAGEDVMTVDFTLKTQDVEPMKARGPVATNLSRKANITTVLKTSAPITGAAVTTVKGAGLSGKPAIPLLAAIACGAGLGLVLSRKEGKKPKV
jgi:hypothetical protein